MRPAFSAYKIEHGAKHVLDRAFPSYLTTFDGTANETEECTVRVPADAGDYAWLVTSPGFVKRDTSYPEASAPIAFTVTPHAMSIVVWDIPPTVVVGERFRVKVGIKCSSECNLSDAGIEIVDDEGRQIGTVVACSKWPGTSALYGAEAELEASAVAGLSTWSARHPSMASRNFWKS